MLQRAASMRREPTPAEAILWRHLSRSQLGYKFRRQTIIGSRIADFYCPAKGLVIEIDGETHDREADTLRDARSGLPVLRFTNLEVKHELEGVLLVIAGALSRLPDRWTKNRTTPSPSSEEEGSRLCLEIPPPLHSREPRGSGW